MRQLLDVSMNLELDKWNAYEIAEIAYESERLQLSIAGDGKINMLLFLVDLISWNFELVKI